MSKTVFTSTISFEDAELQAQAGGYIVTGRARNPRSGKFVVFARAGSVRRFFDK